MEGQAQSLIDLNDSDVLKIEAVLNRLWEKYGHRNVLIDDFPKEAQERFYSEGFKVRVNMYDSNVPGVFVPEIIIEDRVQGEFDPDKQVWEATHDILDLGDGGVIKSEGKGLIVPHKD